jgi:hypothetical protein
LNYLKTLLEEGHKDTPKLISDFFNAAENAGLLIPKGIKPDLLGTAVRAAGKVLEQKKAFFETLVLNGRVQGTPAEILAEAGSLFGKEVGERVGAIVNPVNLAERALADAAVVVERDVIKAAIDAATGVGREAARVIAERGMTLLAEAEAKIVQRAIESGTSGLAGNPLRLSGILRAPLEVLNGQSILGTYNSLFGRTPFQLTQGLVPTQAELTAALRAGISPEGLARYNIWLPQARVFFESLTGDQLAHFNNVMNPLMRSQIRTGMQNIFMNNPGAAEGIFEDFVLYVVPNLRRFSADQASTRIGNFLSIINRNPAEAREALNLLITQFGAVAQALTTAERRALGTLPARLLGRAAAGATGSVGLFLYHFQNTPSGTGGFVQGMGNTLRTGAEGLRDRIDQWFGIRLWETVNPNPGFMEQVAAAGGFPTVEAMREWLAQQARGYLWGNIGTILGGIGAGITVVIGYFRQKKSNGTPDVTPVTPETPLTPPELEPLRPIDLYRMQVASAAAANASAAANAAAAVASSSFSSAASSAAATPPVTGRGGYKKQRHTKRNR